MHHSRNVNIARRQWLGAVCALTCWPLARANTSAYTFGVVPQFPIAEIQRTWSPLLETLSTQLGMQLRLRFYETIPSFEDDFESGKIDFAYLNPYHAVMARRTQGYVPLVRSEKSLTGILAVNKDAPIREIAELDQQRIAFPAPNAFGASLYMRALLTQRFKIRFDAQFVKTHSNAYRAVLTGQAAAAGGIRSTLDRENPEVKNSLRVLYETPPSAPHPVVAHPRIPTAVRDAMRKALLSWNNDSQKSLLSAVQLDSLISADYTRDYAPLEQLGIEKFVIRE